MNQQLIGVSGFQDAVWSVYLVAAFALPMHHVRPILRYLHGSAGIGDACLRSETLQMISLALVAGLFALPAHAAPFIDAPGDFLPTYAGPKDADLDVRFADVVIDPRAGTISFSAVLAGPIDKASGKSSSLAIPVAHAVFRARTTVPRI